MFYWCFISCDGLHVTFVRVEGHFPFLFPYTEFIQISLNGGTLYYSCVSGSSGTVEVKLKNSTANIG